MDWGHGHGKWCELVLNRDEVFNRGRFEWEPVSVPVLGGGGEDAGLGSRAGDVSKAVGSGKRVTGDRFGSRLG